MMGRVWWVVVGLPPPPPPPVFGVSGRVQEGGQFDRQATSLAGVSRPDIL